MKRNSLISFFTNKMYRKITIELLKTKFLQLPGIRHIHSLWVHWRFVKKTQHMNSWERHVEVKRVQHETVQVAFCKKLLSLYSCIVAKDESRNDKEFLKRKQELLHCEIIQEEDLREFREYVQQLSPDETNGTPVLSVFLKYTSALGETN